VRNELIFVLDYRDVATDNEQVYLSALMLTNQSCLRVYLVDES